MKKIYSASIITLLIAAAPLSGETTTTSAARRHTIPTPSEITTRLKDAFDGFIDEVGSHASFILNFFKQHNTVGAIAPSSPALARAITQALADNTAQGKIVLEVGAGTGVFTKKILSLLNDGDRLIAVEFVPEFCTMLEELFKTELESGKLILIQGDILQFNPEAILFDEAFNGFDHIISGLPFNSFDSSFVNKVLTQYKRWIKKGGSISYFEYAALPAIRKACYKLAQSIFDTMSGDNFMRVREELAAFNSSAPCGTEEELVLLNLPPAYSITCYY